MRRTRIPSNVEYVVPTSDPLRFDDSSRIQVCLGGSS